MEEVEAACRGREGGGLEIGVEGRDIASNSTRRRLGDRETRESMCGSEGKRDAIDMRHDKDECGKCK